MTDVDWTARGAVCVAGSLLLGGVEVAQVRGGVVTTTPAGLVMTAKLGSEQTPKAGVKTTTRKKAVEPVKVPPTPEPTEGDAHELLADLAGLQGE